MERTISEEEESGKSFDYKRYLAKLGKNYYWFVGLLTILIGSSYLYLRYTLPLFEVSTYILIKQPSDAINMLGGTPFSSSGSANNVKNLPDPGNEIFKLKSTQLIGKVVDSLQLYMEIVKKGKVKHKPISIDSLPFYVALRRPDPELKSPVYELTLLESGYKLKSEANEVTGTYDSPLFVNGDTLIISKKQSFSLQENAIYKVSFPGRSNVISKYAQRMKVVAAPKAGPNMLQVALQDELPSRAQKFIDVLIYSNDVGNLEFSNQSLKKEMNFLNERLITVRSELGQQENTVRDFKVQNKVTEVSAKANQLLGNLNAIDSKKNDNDLKRSLLNLLEKNIQGLNGHDKMIAGSSGFQDAALSSVIDKYNQLVLERRKIQETGAAQDPRLPAVNSQLDDAKTNIFNSISNARKELATNVNYLAAQESEATGHFVSMPEKEKDFVQVSRILNIKQSLYNFLLQRKEDKNIQLASSEIAESRIIDSRSSNVRNPKPIVIYGIALAMGILIPALVILIRLLLNNTIETRKEVEDSTSIPIAGEIGKAQKKNQEIVITANSVTSEAEQFRTLRTNISYLLHNTSSKVLLVTSCMSDEGKSFISLNLANSLAIGNKKVALLEFDLRNPGLSKKIGLDNSPGISNYLKGEIEIDKVIQPLDHLENLFFASAGYPLASNPGELILSDRMQTLFSHLKQKFDVIIIDTPPVAPVSDALTIGKWADMSFFILRHKYSQRSSLNLINKLHDAQKLPSLTLIINGIQDIREFNYGNDFGYGHGYVPGKKKRRQLLTG
jgi:capsular exopolysaccharide synthesis family protein